MTNVGDLRPKTTSIAYLANSLIDRGNRAWLAIALESEALLNVAFADMKLSHVTIQNYLSIKNLEISFDPQCRILVGINESGKTNILKALNLLSPTATTTRRDVREPGRDEAPITSAFVRFVFDFTPEEKASLLRQLKPAFLSKTYGSPIISVKETRFYTLEEFCNSREGLYRVDITSGNKYAATWTLDKPKIMENWKKVGASCPADFSVALSDSDQVVLKKYGMVDIAEFPEIPEAYLEDATPDDFNKHTAALLKSAVSENLLKVLFWDYQESNVLPPRVILDQFCAKPETCVPLQRMFQLYGISDIPKAIADAKVGSTNALSNLLRRVAEKTSEHFHKTWKEYDEIEFSLTMDGPDLVAGIEDVSNRFALAQRSDGFKRFVTFLLLVSAEQASNLLKDTLLLIDEPETGLHPTGARYLRDELIKISTNNYVLFSTHSIFMIDDRIIKRHLIVKKKDEITETEEVSESNIKDEEVIYTSLGYSIFAVLKERNLIFEGWRDKKLFEIAISNVPPEYEDIQQLEQLGRCFAHGTKQIKNITPLFQAGGRACLILTDNDAVAREQQREYIGNKGYGVWKRYDEVVVGAGQITGEDFVHPHSFADAIRTAAGKHGIPVLAAADLNDPEGSVHALKIWLINNGVEQEEAARSVRDIKETVFENLDGTSIKPEYYAYLRGLLPLVRALR